MSQIQDVKNATDIVQVIGERLALQRSGTYWRGLCPFHGEKSPSFFVNDQFQRYKCFGCGEGGDALTFLEKYEGMTFGEALVYLAEKAGIELTTYTPTPAEHQQERLLAILSLAKEYYHFLLTQHQAGEKARAYLKERGVTAESIKIFQLGYSLPSWDGLIKYLHDKKKYTLQDITDAGLILASQNGRHYDRFRDRIMFPLANHRGQVVGFSGRTMAADVKEAKYINSPETSLYHKGKMLYGFSELFQHIRKERAVVLVEGEFDMISSAQAHLNHVVAVKGSAVTPDHVKLIQRVADTVILALDADSAGIEATKRAIAVARPAHLEVRVASVGQGKDPDELARQNPKAWRDTVKGATSAYEFLLQASLKAHDPNTPEGKRKIMTELAPVLAEIPLVVEQDVYIKKVAEALNVKEALVRSDLDQLTARQKLKPRLRQELAQHDQATTEKKVAAPKLSKAEKLEHYVLFLLLRAEPGQLKTYLKQLGELTQVTTLTRQVVAVLQKLGNNFSIQTLVSELPDDLQSAVFELYHQPNLVAGLESLDVDKEWQKSFRDLKQEEVKQQRVLITERLNELDSHRQKTPEQEAEQERLLADLVKLQASLRA